MASSTGGRPPDHEIEKQLERILRSDLFTKSPTLSRLLEFVVMSELHNREINERKIAKEVFNRQPDDDQTFVRANANHLRKALESYYANSFDLIRIGGPEGRGYRPPLSYNPRSEAEIEYRRGLQFFEKSFYGTIFNETLLGIVHEGYSFRTNTRTCSRRDGRGADH
jgi:hypothetical protein